MEPKGPSKELQQRLRQSQAHEVPLLCFAGAEGYQQSSDIFNETARNEKKYAKILRLFARKLETRRQILVELAMAMDEHVS